VPARRYHLRMVPEGTTERLILRPLEIADAEQIQEIFPHWEIVQYMLDRIPWPYPADGALRFLTEVAIPQGESGVAWQWTIRQRVEPERIIGAITLAQGFEANRGFWLGLPWQGQGFMTEAADWANDYWFETLGHPLLRVAKAIANKASRRISEKQGMHIVGFEERDFVAGRLPSEIWELTAVEWLARRAEVCPSSMARV